jgi:hypothetical protein
MLVLLTTAMLKSKSANQPMAAIRPRNDAGPVVDAAA